MGLLRLFVAVELGEEIPARLAELWPRLQRRAPEAKWVQLAGMHLTLVFLGDTPEERVPKVKELLAQVAARHPPLTLVAKGGGSFGSARGPRVLWVGLEGDTGPFAALQGALAEALREVGHQPEERAFKPHLTLARARDRKGDPKLASCVELLHPRLLGQASIDRISLYQSELGPKGARYTALGEFALRG